MAQNKHWLEPPEWWKKYKPLRWLAILGMLFFAASALYTAKVMIAPGEHPESGKFTEAAPDPVDFFGGLSSYQSVDKARGILESAKLKITATSEHSPRNPKYPPRDLDTIEVEKYVMLEVPGHLTLEFLNNHLYEATFVPSDPGKFAENLHASDPRLPRQRNNRINYEEGALSITGNVDFAATDVGQNLKTKPFIIWRDTRLVDLRDEWDSRFVIAPTSR